MLGQTHLGRYEIRSLIGKGGMGEVYLAYDPSLRRQVAIKLLPADLTQDKLRLSRFKREAHAASSLNHPYILTIYEIGEQDGQHFIATEYIEGETLRHKSRTRLELRELLEIASQVASALSAAHQAGIVHRDIKPENIMLRPDGFAKVLDFGLAKLADETVAAKQGEIDREAPTETKVLNTDPGVVMGTASYMSPEQARGLEVDARSDVWSLGVMLYEMVAGRMPFEGPTTTDVLSMILQREPPSLSLYRSDVPAELERIVEKALTKEREERYQSAKDLGLDLKRLKRRLEMGAELERSITPEEEARRASAQSAAGNREAAISGTTTAVALAASTAEATAAHTFSSAKSVVNARKLAVVLGTLLIATALAAFAYSYFSKPSNAITSVAVLPFTNESGDPNMEYLSDGLSESLINNLSQLPALKVIARGSAFRYKGKEVDPQEVAQALGVQAIVTGRVMQRGDQLQVSAELVDVRDKTQMWGEQFNRRATDLVQVQTEISQHIAEKLRLRLTSVDQQLLAKEAKANPQAYELVLKGRFHNRKLTLEGYQKAIEYYNQAIAIDPNYAQAYAGIAVAYNALGANSYLDPKEMIPKAETAAKKALELDESNPLAHSMLGRIKFNAWDWEGAGREYRRAIELNPNLPAAYEGYATYLVVMGRHEQAVAQAKRVRELDPLRPGVNYSVGYILFFARRYEEAIEQFKKTLELDQNFGNAHVGLGYTYAAKGEYEQAVAEFRETVKLRGENTSDKCYLGYALAKAGQRGEAEAILKRLETTKEYVSPAELAVLYVGLGEKEKSLSALERAFGEHDLQLQYLGIDPAYDSIRSEPRFQDLMRKVGLPQ